ncbi:hypothetical protein ACNKHM_16425 [Shigella sonnei]
MQRYTPAPRSAQGTSWPGISAAGDGRLAVQRNPDAGGNLPLMQQALSAVNNDYSLAGMYAMGVDLPGHSANHY